MNSKKSRQQTSSCAFDIRQRPKENRSRLSIVTCQRMSKQGWTKSEAVFSISSSRLSPERHLSRTILRRLSKSCEHCSARILSERHDEAKRNVEPTHEAYPDDGWVEPLQ